MKEVNREFGFIFVGLLFISLVVAASCALLFSSVMRTGEGVISRTKGFKEEVRARERFAKELSDKELVTATPLTSAIFLWENKKIGLERSAGVRYLTKSAPAEFPFPKWGQLRGFLPNIPCPKANQVGRRQELPKLSSECSGNHEVHPPGAYFLGELSLDELTLPEGSREKLIIVTPGEATIKTLSFADSYGMEIELIAGGNISIEKLSAENSNASTLSLYSARGVVTVGELNNATLCASGELTDSETRPEAITEEIAALGIKPLKVHIEEPGKNVLGIEKNQVRGCSVIKNKAIWATLKIVGGNAF